MATVAEVSSASFDERFLLLAPTGRDAPLTRNLFFRAGMSCTPCKDMDELCERLALEGAACLMIAEEVLVPRAFSRLCRALEQQETWSDLSVLLFTASSSELQAREPTAEVLAPLGNVTLLERPLRPITLLSAAKAALRGRRRQYAARAELMAQQRAVHQRDQFLAMLGHELRNPLAAIALANGTTRARSDAVAQRCDEIIARQVRHLARLVDDLLDVARVTSGKITLRSDYLDLGKLAESCLPALEPMIDARGHKLRFVKSEQPLGVLGDPVRLEQVLVNLLMNAVKYTPPPGEIELSIDRAGDQVRVHVRDDGVGIAPDMLNQVFELFAQAEASLDRAQGGLGIGLTLVRSIIEQHGGTVHAHSAGLGKGSTFSVSLPAAPPPSAANEVSEVQPIAANDPGSRRILIVEDNPDSRELMTLLLSRSGHLAHAAEDGPTGVETALSWRPDVVLIDIGLPGLDGYEVAQQLREKLGASVYLIALTGYGQPDDRRRALEAGFDAHFTKPLDQERFAGLLARLGPSRGVSNCSAF